MENPPRTGESPRAGGQSVGSGEGWEPCCSVYSKITKLKKVLEVLGQTIEVTFVSYKYLDKAIETYAVVRGETCVS